MTDLSTAIFAFHHPVRENENRPMRIDAGFRFVVPIGATFVPRHCIPQALKYYVQVPGTAGHAVFLLSAVLECSSPVILTHPSTFSYMVSLRLCLISLPSNLRFFRMTITRYPVPYPYSATWLAPDPNPIFLPMAANSMHSQILTAKSQSMSIGENGQNHLSRLRKTVPVR
jgi:hypothetical protein